MNFGGFLALLIGLSIWAFVIGAVILAFIESDSDKKKE